MPRRSGFTLIEVLVVLILMGLAVALVAPALLSPDDDESDLSQLLSSARELAARRGEVIYVHIESTGQWRMEAGATPAQPSLATGRVPPFVTGRVTLMVSPLGSCAFDLRSAAAADAVSLDPLTCEIRAP